MILKIRTKRMGNHIHAVFFMGDVEGCLANLGRLIFTIEEWDAFKNRIKDSDITWFNPEGANTHLIFEDDEKPWSELTEQHKPLAGTEFTGRKIRP